MGGVIPELFPMIDVEDPPAELQILGGTRLAFGGSNLGSDVTFAGRFQIFNPAGSGAIITVTKFVYAHGLTSGIRWGVVNQAIATVGTERFADTRGNFTALPVGQINQLLSVALAPATGQTLSIGNTPFTLEDRKGLFVLAPGTGLEVGCAIINNVVRCTFFWRERTALESELNL